MPRRNVLDEYIVTIKQTFTHRIRVKADTSESAGIMALKEVEDGCPCMLELADIAMAGSTIEIVNTERIKHDYYRKQTP